MNIDLFSKNISEDELILKYDDDKIEDNDIENNNINSAEMNENENENKNIGATSARNKLINFENIENENSINEIFTRNKLQQFIVNITNICKNKYIMTCIFIITLLILLLIIILYIIIK